MKHFLISLLFALATPLWGQVYSSEKFIEYEKVISELEANQNIETVRAKYDFTFILLLDSTQIELVEKVSPQSLEYFKEYAPGLLLSNSTVGFKTDKKDIKEIFKDKATQSRILSCLHTNKSPDIERLTFDFPIYIKENKAIFETSGPTWSDTYFARLENGVLQINWLGGVIE